MPIPIYISMEGWLLARAEDTPRCAPVGHKDLGRVPGWKAVKNKLDQFMAKMDLAYPDQMDKPFARWKAEQYTHRSYCKITSHSP
jgi:hypothetical protein